MAETDQHGRNVGFTGSPIIETVKTESSAGDDFNEADLGLGRGYKPGGIPRNAQDEDVDRFTVVRVMKQTTPENQLNGPKETDKTPSSSQRNSPKHRRRRLSDRFRLLRRSKTEQHEGSDDEVFPTFAEVPLGTTLRQQRRLYEDSIDQLFCRCSLDDTGMQMSASSENRQDDSTNDEIKKRLKKAKEEADILRQDLELCQLQLDAKYKAISILQKQSQALNSKHEDKFFRAKQLEYRLEQEVNKLQFELDYRENKLMETQQTWAERFDKVTHDNMEMREELEVKLEELKRMNSEKMVVIRERDELLALLDVQDRQKYARDHTYLDENTTYNSFTSAELSILGACHCRGQNAEPCGCAHAAVKLKRELALYKEEVESLKQREEEAMVTVDAYRIAFEEQLTRSRSLVRQLATFTAGSPNKMAKAKTALKWLIKHINDDDLREKGQDAEDTEDQDQNMNSRVTTKLNGINGTCNNDHELFIHLLEMINDKTEALAHQRLAARMLASKTQELQQKLSTIQEEVCDK